MKPSLPIVFIVCSGLGRVNRGYETFTQECFEALRNNSQFKLMLLKGGGAPKVNEFVLPNLYRKSRLSLWLGKIFKVESYVIEQFSFVLSMLPFLIRKRPKLIYYSDFILGTYLWHLRRFFKFKYRLLFSNGAPNGPPFKTEDHVQQLLGYFYDDAIQKGTSPKKQTLLPYGFNIPAKPTILGDIEKDKWREILDLPKNKKIIISIGAINTSHKRMDYVIKEFATIDPRKYFLIILGQIDRNSTVVLDLASEILLPESYRIAEVKGPDVSRYLSVADYFILASLNEGFGRVMIEALQHGLMPIVHDYPVAKEVLKTNGVFGDLTKSGVVYQLINTVDSSFFSKEDLWAYAYDSFSWQKLKHRYFSLISDNLR